MSRSICTGFAALAITITLAFSGCCTRGGYGGGGCMGGSGGFLDQFMQEQVSCLQEKVWARRAFHLRFGHCERIHADHFRDGFVAGYCNVCDGKGGQIPTLPPDKYWGFNYRNQEGVEMQNAWFAGFEAGAQSARSDGSGNWQGIQIPRQVQEAIMEAQAIEDNHSGIEREYVLEMNEAAPGGIPLQPAVPQTNMPSVPDSTAASNMPLAQPGIIPGSYGTSTSIPNQPVPIIRRPSR
jgi:hypothetical protein